MPDKKIDLALAFMQSHPDAAANLLEQQSIGDIALFFETVPHTYAVPVIEQMLPQYTARLCKLLAPTVAAAFLSQMNYSMVSAVLRHSSSTVRYDLMELLPESTRLACRLLLNYSEDTVGAWMITQAPSLPIDNTASQALQLLIHNDSAVSGETIYIVNRERYLEGQTSYANLLRAQGETPISSLMHREVQSILGRTSLEAAARSDAWRESDSIAVINRQKQFVGILRHLDLRKGISQIANAIETPPGSDPITSILSVYGNSLFSLLNTVGEIAGASRK